MAFLQHSAPAGGAPMSLTDVEKGTTSEIVMSSTPANWTTVLDYLAPGKLIDVIDLIVAFDLNNQTSTHDFRISDEAGIVHEYSAAYNGYKKSALVIANLSDEAITVNSVLPADTYSGGEITTAFYMRGRLTVEVRQNKYKAGVGAFCQYNLKTYGA